MLICRNAEGMHHQRKVGDPWNRQTDISSGTEFIAPDVLFKTTNAGAPKKHRGYPDMFPSGELAAALPSNLSVK